VAACEVRRVTGVGLAVNVALSLLKGAAGFLANSQAVLADGVHSLSDVSTDVAVLVGVRYWSKPPDTGHPHGHRRIETLVALGIGVVLVVVAVGLAYRALATMRQEHAAPPGWLALGAALLSIAGKEALYRWTVRAGKRIRSPALIANAWHHRSDALSSIPVAIAVAGAKLRPGWQFLDHVGAVVVSVFIFVVAARIVAPLVQELMDAGSSQRDRERITEIAAGTAGVEVVHAVRTRRLGSALAVDLHILVDGQMTVRRGHEIAEQVTEHLLAEGPDVVDVVVHLEPRGSLAESEVRLPEAGGEP